MSTSRGAAGVTVSVRSLVSVFEKESLSAKTSPATRQCALRRSVNNGVNTSHEATISRSSDTVGRSRLDHQITLPPPNRDPSDLIDVAARSSTRTTVLPDVVCSTSESTVKTTSSRHQSQSSSELERSSSLIHVSCSSDVVSSANRSSSDAKDSAFRAEWSSSSLTVQQHQDNQDDIPTTMLFAAVKNIFEKKHNSQYRHQRNQHQQRLTDERLRLNNNNNNNNQQVNRSSNLDRKLSPISTDTHLAVSEIDRQIRIRLRKSAVDASSCQKNSLALPLSWREQAWNAASNSPSTESGGSVGRLADMFNARLTAFVTAADNHANRRIGDDVKRGELTIPPTTVLRCADIEPCSSQQGSDELLSTHCVPPDVCARKNPDVIVEETKENEDVMNLLTGDALNLSAPKQRVKLRQRGSLANRRKPSLSSLRASSSQCMYDVIPTDVTCTATEPRRPRSHLTNTLPASSSKLQYIQQNVVDGRQPSECLMKGLSRRHHSLHSLTTIVDNSSQGDNTLTETISDQSASVMTLPQSAKDKHQLSDTDAKLPSYSNWLQIMKTNGRPPHENRTKPTVDQVTRTPTPPWMIELRTRLKHNGKQTAAVDD